MAVSRGLAAQAINEDTVRGAFYEKRDLFDELASGDGVRVGVMSPQMLRGSRTSSFLASIAKQRAVRWMMVDEAHSGRNLGYKYGALLRLRTLSKCAIALTATPANTKPLVCICTGVTGLN